MYLHLLLTLQSHDGQPLEVWPETKLGKSQRKTNESGTQNQAATCIKCASHPSNTAAVDESIYGLGVGANPLHLQYWSLALLESVEAKLKKMEESKQRETLLSKQEALDLRKQYIS